MLHMCTYQACLQTPGFWECLLWIHMSCVLHRSPMSPRTLGLRPLTRWPPEPGRCALNHQREWASQSQHTWETAASVGRKGVGGERERGGRNITSVNLKHGLNTFSLHYHVLSLTKLPQWIISQLNSRTHTIQHADNIHTYSAPEMAIDHDWLTLTWSKITKGPFTPATVRYAEIKIKQTISWYFFHV